MPMKKYGDKEQGRVIEEPQTVSGQTDREVTEDDRREIIDEDTVEPEVGSDS